MSQEEGCPVQRTPAIRSPQIGSTLTVTIGGGSWIRLDKEAKLAVQLSGTHDTTLLQSSDGL